MKGNRAKIERLQTKYSNAVRKMLWDELCTQRPAFPMFGKGFLICVYLMAHFQHLQELAENKVTDLFFLRYFLRDVIQEHRVIEWILLTYRDNPLYLIFGTIILGIICGFIRKATAKRNVPKLGEKIERLRREILSLGGSIPYITGVYWDETEGRYYYESHDTSKKTGGSGSTSGAGGSGSTSGAGDSGSAYSTGSSRAYKSDSTGNRTAYGEKTDSAGYTEAARKMFGIDPEGDDSEPDDRNTEWNTDDDDIPEGIRKKKTSRNIVTIRYSDLSDSKITIVPTTSPVSDTCSWKIISPESMRPNLFCLMFRADSGIALKTIFHIRRGSWTAFPRLTANAISRYRHYLPTLGREIHPIILTGMIFRKSNERITINFAPRIWRTTSDFLKVRLRVREKSCAPEHMRA